MSKEIDLDELERETKEMQPFAPKRSDLGNAYDDILGLIAYCRELKNDYDRLYEDWRRKNEACNEAFSQTIPRLRRSLDRHERALSRAMRTIDGTMPAELVQSDVDSILNPHVGGSFDAFYDEHCNEDE